jgi:flagellar assembly protein FliH
MTLPFESLAEERRAGMFPVVPLEFEDLRETLPEGVSDDVLAAVPSATDDPSRTAAYEALEARLQSLSAAQEEEIETVRRETREAVWREQAKELDEKIEQERAAVARVCEKFASERRRYFAKVEEQIVKLSLAIAAQILHREIKIDPLLLQGTAKVALEKMQGNETVSLRVPEGQAEEWRRIFVAMQRDEVSVVSDNRLAVGECVLETSVGRVELGVQAQLEEVGKGFFDLLAQRPA